jgi:hypothetical protein
MRGLVTAVHNVEEENIQSLFFFYAIISNH